MRLVVWVLVTVRERAFATGGAVAMYLGRLTRLLTGMPAIQKRAPIQPAKN